MTGLCEFGLVLAMMSWVLMFKVVETSHGDQKVLGRVSVKIYWPSNGPTKVDFKVGLSLTKPANQYDDVCVRVVPGSSRA